MLNENIQIKPIFNQTEPIWQEFTRIELLCDSVKYGLNCDEQDYQRIMSSHEIEWKLEKKNFAFAAYDESKMVGFTNGFLLKKGDMYLRNLYVEPEYNGMGIGSKLLKLAENEAILHKPAISGVALDQAVSFYLQKGYVNYDIRYVLKELSKIPVGVVPLFGAYVTSMRLKNKVSYDKTVLKKCKNQPAFIYVNPVKEIDAIAVLTPENEKIIWVNDKKPEYFNLYKRELSRALDKSR